jgi:membrane-bound lytic murein transglycosylase D
VKGFLRESFSCMLHLMQLLSSISKYLFLVVLSGSILIGWNSVYNNTNTPDYFFAPESTQATKPANTIWDSMSQDFTLDHQARSQRVQAEIRKLVADQGRLNEILKAAGPYIYFIYQQTHARGLPAELALIPFIESEFNPNDHSNKGALGLWQLMPGTARELGVKVHDGYDGRRNVIASTNAALAYFNDLGNNFNGNWYLAIAAYNCGQGKVESATRRLGTSNYWNLPLPTETKYYVPKLLAVAEIVKNPEKYGVELPPIDNEPYFKQVEVSKPVTLTNVAKTSGVDIKTLHTLNPDLKRTGTVVAQKNGARTLLVPVNKSINI